MAAGIVLFAFGMIGHHDEPLKDVAGAAPAGGVALHLFAGEPAGLVALAVVTGVLVGLIAFEAVRSAEARRRIRAAHH